MQLIQLDRHIRLLDSPGLILAASSSHLSPAALALKNAVRIEALDDPITPVQAILERASKTQLMIHYRLPAFDTVDQFLSLLAKKSGCLRKGGIPDPEKAARSVLFHWNSGRIKYFTDPPEAPLVHISAEIVQEMASEFDLSSLDKMESAMLEDGSLPRVLPSHTLRVAAECVATQMQPLSMEEDDSFSTAETKAVSDNISLLPEKIRIRLEEKVAKRDVRKKEQASPLDESVEGNQKLNRASKMAFKKKRKGSARAEKRIVKLAEVFSGASIATPGVGGDGYSFESDFKL